MGNKRRIDNSCIIRNIAEEKALGIKNLNVYAYMDEYSLVVIGEIHADKLNANCRFLCSVYDEDGDIVASHENETYGSGVVTRSVNTKSFYDGFPFKIRMDIPEKVSLSKIRIEPKR